MPDQAQPGQARPGRSPIQSARLVARNTWIQTGGDIVSRIATLVFYVVMARALGQRGFGDFVFAASVVLLIELAGFGSDLIITSDVARDRRAIDRLFWNTNALKVALGIVAVGLALAVGFAGDYGADVRVAIGVLALARMLEVLAKTIHATFRGLEDMAPIALGLIVQRFSTAAAGIGAMAAGAGLVLVCVVYLGGAVLGLAYVGLALFRRGVRPAFAPSLADARTLLGRSLPLGLSWVIGAVLARLDAVLLSFLKDNAAVGLYGASYRLYEAAAFLSWNFGFAALPALARLSQRTSPTLGRAYEAGCKVLALVLFPVGASFILFPDPIMEIVYGEEYLPAASATRLLGIITASYGFFMLSAQLLVSQERQRVVVLCGVGVLIENVVLNLLLIPSYSFDGAAAAMVASGLTFAGLLVLFSLRAAGRISWTRVAVGPIVGCAGMGLVALVLGTRAPGLVTAMAAYALLVLLLERWLFPRDVRLLRESLRWRSASTEGPRATASGDAPV